VVGDTSFVQGLTVACGGSSLSGASRRLECFETLFHALEWKSVLVTELKR